MRVMVAVKSLALQHLIEHILKTIPDLEIVARVNAPGGLARAVRHRHPDLVVANARGAGSDARGTITSIKRSRPETKLIMICSVEGFARDVRKCGADACLAEEALVRQLMPAVCQLSDSQPGNTRSTDRR
jgi:DNA-binding NarL/FixJ family response regulator